MKAVIGRSNNFGFRSDIISSTIRLKDIDPKSPCSRKKCIGLQTLKAQDQTPDEKKKIIQKIFSQQILDKNSQTVV